MTRFENHYLCPECGACWGDEWDSACDDECPACGARDIAPIESEEMDDEDE